MAGEMPRGRPDVTVSLLSFLQRRYVVYKAGEDPELKAEKDKAILALVRRKRQLEREQGAKSPEGSESTEPMQ